MLQPADFFDLKDVGPRGLFQDVEFVWEALGRLKAYLKESLSPNVSRLGGDMITKTRVLWEGEVIEERLSPVADAVELDDNVVPFARENIPFAVLDIEALDDRHRQFVDIHTDRIGPDPSPAIISDHLHDMLSRSILLNGKAADRVDYTQ